MTGVITVLNRETLRTIRAKVFRHDSTMIQQAASYSVTDYEATLTVIRTRLFTLIQALPDAAFVIADAPHGGDTWTAGQVVAHVCDAQMNIVLPVVRHAARLPPGSSTRGQAANRSYPVLTREESLVTLEDADRDLRNLFEAIPEDIDLSRTVDDDLVGVGGVRDSLLYLAIHDDDHLSQLENLLAG